MARVDDFWFYFNRWIQKEPVVFSRLLFPLGRSMFALEVGSSGDFHFFFTDSPDFSGFSHEDRDNSIQAKARLVNIVMDQSLDARENQKKISPEWKKNGLPPLPLPSDNWEKYWLESTISLSYAEKNLVTMQFFWDLTPERAKKAGFAFPAASERSTIRTSESLPISLDALSGIISGQTDLREFAENALLRLLNDANFSPYFSGFHPFFLGNFPEYDALNKALGENRKIYFLNGQDGTGKCRFFYSHLRLRALRISPEIIRILAEIPRLRTEGILMFQKDNDELLLSPARKIQEIAPNPGCDRFLFIPEIMDLSPDELKYLEDFIRQDDPSDFIFILSRYNIEVGKDAGLVDAFLMEILLRNRIIFPSVSGILSRSYGKEMLAEIIENHYSAVLSARIGKEESRIALQKMMETIMDHTKNSHNLQPLFFIGQDMATVPAGNKNPGRWLDDSLSEGKLLRDIIASIEKASIEYAYKHIAESQQEVADFLGISRGSLQHKLKKFRLGYSEPDVSDIRH